MREIVLISAFVHLMWIHEMFEPGLQTGGFHLLGDINFSWELKAETYLLGNLKMVRDLERRNDANEHMNHVK